MIQHFFWAIRRPWFHRGLELMELTYSTPGQVYPDQIDLCRHCGHWRDEHVQPCDNTHEDDYCEACWLLGNPKHQFEAVL